MPKRYTDNDTIPKWDNYFLAEGWCPNKCGPMAKVGRNEAVCPSCGFELISKRVPHIFPADGKRDG